MSLNKLSIFVPHASDFLTNHRSHGDGLTAYGFISRLAERGYRLHVAAPEMDLQGALPANIELHRIKTVFRSTVLHRLEYMVKSRLLLNRLRRTEQIDVIHQLNPVNKGLSLAMLSAGLPVVLGVIVPSWPPDAEMDAEEDVPRQSVLRRLRAALKRAVKRWVLALQQWQAAALLLVTPAARAELYDAERAAEKITLLPIGIDLARFSPTDGPQGEVNPASPPNILFLANLWRRKGIFTLLEAFARVAERVPDCRLTIAGGGREEAEVRRLVAASPYRQRIDMMGAVARADVPAMLQRCTVYCLPSYGEPFGISVLEAMACAKPVVVTAAGGVQELVPDGGGRKVPPRDADALATALLEIVSSPALQAEMGRRNRQWVEQRFAWERVIDQLETVYEKVLAARPQSQTSSLAADC